MRRAVFLPLLVCLTLLTAQSQEPPKVAGEIYKAIIENGSVRVVDLNIPAGGKTALQSHSDSVAIVLEASTIRWGRPGGASEESGAGFTRGSSLYMAADTHAWENTGTAPAHIILVEFKKPAPFFGRNPSLPEPYKLAAANPHAAVFEATVAPGETVPKHAHGDNVVVPLTDATLEATDEQGHKQTLSFKKDTATFQGPATHSEVNTGQTPAHFIVVELK